MKPKGREARYGPPERTGVNSWRRAVLCAVCNAELGRQDLRALPELLSTGELGPLRLRQAALAIRIEYIRLPSDPDGTPRYGLGQRALRARPHDQHSSLRGSPKLPGFKSQRRAGIAVNADQDWRVLDAPDRDEPFLILHCVKPICLARNLLDRRPATISRSAKVPPPE